MICTFLHLHTRNWFRKLNVITLTGIFHSSDSSDEARSLLRPQIIINCPIGFASCSSNRDSPRASAVFFTGPIPSPPPISKTAGNWGSISSSILKSSYSNSCAKMNINGTNNIKFPSKEWGDKKKEKQTMPNIHLANNSTAKRGPDWQSKNTYLRFF